MKANCALEQGFIPQIFGQRWRGAIRGGGERLEMEGSDQRWRGAVIGGGKPQEVEGSYQRWKKAISGEEIL